MIATAPPPRRTSTRARAFFRLRRNRAAIPLPARTGDGLSRWWRARAAPSRGGARLAGREEGEGPEGVDGALGVAGPARKARLRGEGAEKGAVAELGGGEALAGEGGEGLVARVDLVAEPGGDRVGERRGGLGGGEDRVGGGQLALLGLQRGEKRVWRGGLRGAATLLAETREEDLVGQLGELRVGAREVEVGQRLRVGVVQLADVRVQEERSDLMGRRKKRKKTSSKS